MLLHVASTNGARQARASIRLQHVILSVYHIMRYRGQELDHGQISTDQRHADCTVRAYRDKWTYGPHRSAG